MQPTAKPWVMCRVINQPWRGERNVGCTLQRNARLGLGGRVASFALASTYRPNIRHIAGVGTRATSSEQA